MLAFENRPFDDQVAAVRSSSGDVSYLIINGVRASKFERTLGSPYQRRGYVFELDDQHTAILYLKENVADRSMPRHDHAATLDKMAQSFLPLTTPGRCEGFIDPLPLLPPLPE